MKAGIETIDVPLEISPMFDGTAEFSLIARREQGRTGEFSQMASHPKRDIRFVVDLSAIGVDADIQFEIHAHSEPRVKISTIWGHDSDLGANPNNGLIAGMSSDPGDLNGAGNRVREIRESKLLTQSQLARKAGLALRTIHNVENGMTCRIGTKRKILLALGVSSEDQEMVFPPKQHSMPMISAATREQGVVPHAMCISKT